MKALTWHGKRDVRVGNVPDPTIQEPRKLSRFLADSQSALIRRCYLSWLEELDRIGRGSYRAGTE
jgi:hypothetical protein